MSTQSSRFFSSWGRSNGRKDERRARFGKLAIGLLCLGLICLVSSSMQASDPIISACTGTGFTTIANLAKVQLLTCHNVSSAADVQDKFDAIRITNGNPKPIIFSDDGQNASGKTQCQGHDLMKACLEKVMGLGCSFEHLDSCLDIGLDIGGSLTVLEEGGTVIPDDVNNWPPNSKDCLEELLVYGAENILTIGGHLAVVNNVLKWASGGSSYPIKLVGFSNFGAIAAGTTIFPNLNTYLNNLASFYINFTRIFVVDPWSNHYNATFPFAKPNQYNLSQKNQTYFNRLHDFVTYAASKGIVVQISVFDRCGITDSTTWSYNPYNDSLNTSAYFADLAQFQNTGNHDIACYHSTFIKWVQDAISGSGNVILEIMNEPWTAPNPLSFHTWVADRIRNLMPQVTSFTGTPLSCGTGTIRLSWQNPNVSSFSGTMIRYSTSASPSSPTAGSLLVDKTNTPGSSDTYDHTGLSANQTIYYSAFAHDCYGNYSSRTTVSATSPGSITPVTAFWAIAHGVGQINLTWRNPNCSTFTGTLIVFSTSGYPTNPYDGELVIDKPNNPNTTDRYTHTGLGSDVTYYYSAFAHDNADNYSVRATAHATALGNSPAPGSDPNLKQ